MSVESEPGLGSTFTVTLPLRQAAAEEVASATAEEPVSL
jgi:chemotaxis protein histidine kinase CheA